ncbi:MAG TPA: nuclear transport factor 2 family protein [Candidatus Binatia bacterium]|jgi:ketosteroid isomerase-like protein|nr:nuclear transport factor 2 family protein [Candidatus Binatia bacterium]
MSGGDEEVEGFLGEWARAERQGDAGQLERQLDDDFVGVGPLGFVLSKQDWLSRFGHGLTYDDFSIEDTRVRRDGDAAIVVGTQNQSGSMQGNPLPFSSVRSTLVLRRRPGGWRLASVHMSFIAGTPGAPPVPGR